MSLHQNNELLEICKSRVAAKFNSADYTKWVNNDFVRLSEDILEGTKQYISPTSLKRIFGKISSDALPKQSTLDILVKYIGYESWKEFSSVHASSLTISNSSDISPEKTSGSNSAKKLFSKNIILVGIGLILLTIGLILFIRKDSKDINYKFSLQKKLGEAPYTAHFTVEVEREKEDEIIVDFSDPFETDEQFLKYILKENTRSVSHTYMIPGVYHPHLIVNKKILDTIDLPVYSKGWEWVVVNYHEKERAFHTIQDKPYFRNSGIFCVPSGEVAKYKVDTLTGYCMRYLYYKDFNVSHENLKLELKTCNPVFATKKCSNIEVQLKFINWNVGFMLFHKGCNGNYSRVQLGSKILNGIDNDLSMFELDLNQWQDVLVEIKKNTAYISVNGKIIFEGKIEGDPGTFQGISINSQESAKLDYLRIQSSGEYLLAEEY